MGFLKNTYCYLLISIFIIGCAPSVIELGNYKDDNPYSQYGNSPQREFYYDWPIGLNFREKWESEINGGFSNSTVISYDSAVFVNDLSGRLYCFSITNGKTLGQLKYKGSITCAPIINETSLIFVVVKEKENISSLVYYDFKLGREKSSTEIGGRITVELLKVSDGIIIISESGTVYKYDFMGGLVWDYDTKSFVHSSPASDNKYAVFGNDDGEIICLDVGTGNLIYRKKIATSSFAGTVISDSQMYIGNESGNLYCIDLLNGNIIWKFQTGARIKMNAVVRDNKVFIGNLKGDLFRLDRREGKLVWKIGTNGLLNSTPLLTPDYLILPNTNRKVYIISANEGEIIDSLLFDGRVKLSPTIKNNLLFIGYENSNLKAYEITE